MIVSIPDLCILTYYSGPLLHVYSGDVDLNQIMLKDPIVFGITKEKVKCILCAPNVSVYFVCIYNALEQKNPDLSVDGSSALPLLLHLIY